MVKSSELITYVFLCSLLILVLLPFYYHSLIIEETDSVDHVEKATIVAFEALTSLKSTTTAYDTFLEEREKRRQERLKQRIENERTEAEILDKLQGLKSRTEESQETPLTDQAKSIETTMATTSDDIPLPTLPETKGLLEIYTDLHGGALPVLVVCYNRAKELSETLDSLLAQKRIDPSLILVSQDGTNPFVKNVAVQRNLKIVQNLSIRKTSEGGGKRIATHYRFSLDKIFETFPDAPAIVVLEDDLLTSVDFMEWLVAAGRIVEIDKTLWCVSAWNDNGFETLVKDSYGVKRTNFFPGLGWLLFRSEYETNLKPSWPLDNWDWYVRSTYQNKYRECLYPEVPRAFHKGKTGTFVDVKIQHDIFDRMVYNQDKSLDWFGEIATNKFRAAISPAYDNKIIKILKASTTHHLKNAAEFESLIDKQIPIIVIWYEADPDPQREKIVKSFTTFFGIWHQLLRGSHEAMHDVLYRNTRIYLINTFQPRSVQSIWFSSYSRQTIFFPYKPSDVPVFTPTDFVSTVQLGPNGPISRSVIAENFGESCRETCSKDEGKLCDEEGLGFINSCQALQLKFNCQVCSASIGEDQPCFVSPDAPVESSPGTCLFNSQNDFNCDGKHVHTKRLCVCK